MSSENGKRLPEWLKILGVVAAMLGSGGGSGWVVASRTSAEVAGTQAEVLHKLDARLLIFEERLSNVTETTKIRERIREEVRGMVKAEALR